MDVECFAEEVKLLWSKYWGGVGGGYVKVIFHPYSSILNIICIYPFMFEIVIS